MSKQGKQVELPGLEDRSLAVIEQAADAYIAARDERADLSKKESRLKEILRQTMKNNGRLTYNYNGLQVRLENLENLKVEKRPASETLKAARPKKPANPTLSESLTEDSSQKGQNDRAHAENVENLQKFLKRREKAASFEGGSTAPAPPASAPVAHDKSAQNDLGLSFADYQLWAIRTGQKNPASVARKAQLTREHDKAVLEQKNNNDWPCAVAGCPSRRQDPFTVCAEHRKSEFDVAMRRAVQPPARQRKKAKR